MANISIDALPPVIQLPLGTLSVPGKLTLRNPTGTYFPLETGFVDAVTLVKIPSYSGAVVTTVPTNGTPLDVPFNFPPPGTITNPVLPYVQISGGVFIAYAGQGSTGTGAIVSTLIGEIIPITGQSNDYHLWSVTDPLAPLPNAETRMMTPTSGGWVTPTGALITGLNLLRRHLKRPVAAVVTAMPSIGLTRASTGSGDYWNNTAGATFVQHAAMLAAAGGDFGTWVMSGCEADGLFPTITPAMIADGHAKLRDDTLALLAPMYGTTTVRPRAAVRLGVNLIGSLVPVGADSARTRAGQLEFVRRTQETFVASWADDLSMDGAPPSIHFAVDQLVLRAERMALAIAANSLCGMN